MYYKELEKYLKRDSCGFPSLELYEYAKCYTYEPMLKVMEEYFEINLGDLMNDLIEHKRKPFYKRIWSYHKELEIIYIRMINVIVPFNAKDRFGGF